MPAESRWEVARFDVSGITIDKIAAELGIEGEASEAMAPCVSSAIWVGLDGPWMLPL